MVTVVGFVPWLYHLSSVFVECHACHGPLPKSQLHPLSPPPYFSCSGYPPSCNMVGSAFDVD
ncbi:hypothetical protein L208DRAFT_49795 [Tricholoma matsutake]|nr:hypothetical protein L208DRAFT_49795 [Tricholoma matsutake 945]